MAAEPHSVLPRRLAVALAGALLVLAACKPSAGIDDDTLYRRAIEDARDPRPDEIRALVPVRRGTPGLRWDADGARVAVVTWETSDFLGLGSQTTPTEVWVTVVPELRERCRAEDFTGAGAEVGLENEDPDRSDAALRRRLGQLLGLPPAAANDTLFEIWASPRDLRRPCPDPEIDDDRCSLAFPPDVAAEHRAWIERLRTEQYGPPDDPRAGYPWTQLGATYDWSPSSGNHQGPSELVIDPGAQIEVVSAGSASDYCGD
jgi:hypothetical protein